MLILGKSDDFLLIKIFTRKLRVVFKKSKLGWTCLYCIFSHSFQVVARENKGLAEGIDTYKSTMVKFSTKDIQKERNSETRTTVKVEMAKKPENEKYENSASFKQLNIPLIILSALFLNQ